MASKRHWRYISAFHGPWLQLPHEILESLTHNNFLSNTPRQTEPGILFDLVKIRRLVDEAADLAVRAQNGTASSALHAENSRLEAALGLNTRGGAGGNARLSPERRYRMREMATAKLSQAYRLDEIAASVCMMQSASALENVASLVLQRTPNSTDAKYVHFFHERIPSRMVAECTTFEALNDIIAREPGHAAPYRTRALLKIHKEDYHGAAQDLTEALTICRAEYAKYASTKNQLVSMKEARESIEKRKVWNRDWMSQNRVLEEDQPKGLELQLLFQRGNQYLSIASAHLRPAIEAFTRAERCKKTTPAESSSPANSWLSSSKEYYFSTVDIEAYRCGLEARELVRKYAKRALRDYTAFLSHLDYACALDVSSEFSLENGHLVQEESLRKSSTGSIAKGGKEIQALVPRQPLSKDKVSKIQSQLSIPREPSCKTYPLAIILSSTPPNDLPPFPQPNANALATFSQLTLDLETPLKHCEMLAYHPFLPETIHSLLLTHCLLQTDPTTLRRIAENAARLVRLATGYPFFLSSRSPARADWIEILRQADNWIGLRETWSQLCKPEGTADRESDGEPATEPKPRKKTVSTGAKGLRSEQSSETQPEKITNQAVADALSDDRVVDDESFGEAVRARMDRGLREMKTVGPSDVANADNVDQANETTQGSSSLERNSSNTGSESLSMQNSAESFDTTQRTSEVGTPVAKDEEYMLGTERADCISKWILEVPVNPAPLESGGPRSKKKKKPASKKGRLSHQSSDVSLPCEKASLDRS